MKHLIALSFFIINCYWVNAQNQRSIIGTEKVILKYNTQKDSLLIPVVSSAYPRLKETLSIKNILNGDDIKSIKAEYSESGQGITSLRYKVTYEDKSIISIILYIEAMGAYPTSWQQWLTLNIQTGKAYTLGNELSKNNAMSITRRYRSVLKGRITKKLQFKGNGTEEKQALKQLCASADTLSIKTIFSKYIFTDKGVLFATEDELPHAIQALEPNREVFFTYQQLNLNKVKPYTGNN